MLHLQFLNYTTIFAYENPYVLPQWAANIALDLIYPLTQQVWKLESVRKLKQRRGGGWRTRIVECNHVASFECTALYEDHNVHWPRLYTP